MFKGSCHNKIKYKTKISSWLAKTLNMTLNLKKNEVSKETKELLV